MKRRKFLKYLAGVPLVAAIPGIAIAVTGSPKPVNQLLTNNRVGADDDFFRNIAKQMGENARRSIDNIAHDVLTRDANKVLDEAERKGITGLTVATY